MATPVDFEGANLYLRGNGKEVMDLPVFHKTVEGEPFEFISCWRLTPEEIAEIVATGVVWTSVWQHSANVGPPPLGVSGAAMVHVNGVPSRAQPVMPKRPAT